ncbi:MAG: hypothetical protein JWR10_800 [Rubritepida sp.]|nr:hypothetical protein [Rubritepida sp.]
MMFARRAFIGGAAPILAGCCDPNRPEPNRQPSTSPDPIPPGTISAQRPLNQSTLFQRNLRQGLDNSALSAPVTDIYARFVITTKILQEGWNGAIPAASTSIAGKLWQAIKGEFDESTTRYVLNFSIPTGIGNFDSDDALGLKIPLFVLDYSGSARNRSPTLMARNVGYAATPWQQISSSDALLFKIFGQSSNVNNIQASRVISGVTSTLASIGTILAAGPTAGLSVVVGALAQPAVQRVASTIDSTVSSALSTGSTVVSVQALGPRVKVEQDNRYFWTKSDWFLQTSDGIPVFEVVIQIEFASNMVRPEASNELVQPTQAVQNFAPDTILGRSKTPYPGWSSPATLQEISLNAPELTGLSNALSSKPYALETTRQAIQTAVAAADGYLSSKVGLTPLDSIRAIGEIANGRIAFADPDIMKVPFFFGNRTFLTNMGFPVPPMS